MRHLLLIAVTITLGACVRVVPDARPPQTAIPVPSATTAAPNAALAAISRGPDAGSLGLGAGDASTALASFRESCPALLKREDQSGLTQAEDWRPACEAASNWSASDARRFFTSYFETARVGDGAAFATGYFEPEIRGSRTRAPGYDVPVYAMPPELVRDWPDEILQSERTGRPPLGRRDASGKFVTFYERAEIEQGALANRGLEIAWAADPVEFFFLQIQSSQLNSGQRMMQSITEQLTGIRSTICRTQIDGRALMLVHIISSTYGKCEEIVIKYRFGIDLIRRFSYLKLWELLVVA